MIASPLGQMHINPKILQRQMRLYVTRLIAKAKKNPTINDSTKEMVLNFLDKSKLLGDIERYVQLLEHFANDLQKSTHIGMLDKHLETALANPELSNRLRVELSNVRILLLIQRGELALARQVLDAAWLAANMPILQAMLYNREAVLFEVQEDYQSSLSRYEKALALAQTLGNLVLISGIYNNLGYWAYLQAKNQEALRYYTNGLEVAKQLNDPRTIAPLEGGLAITLDELEQYEEANYYHTAARKHYEEAGHLIGLVRCDLNLSRHALKQGKSVEAKELAGSAFELAQQLGDLDRVASAWHNLGQAYQIEHNYQVGLEYLLKALQRRQWLGLKHFEKETLQEIEFVAHILEANDTIDTILRERLLKQCYSVL